VSAPLDEISAAVLGVALGIVLCSEVVRPNQHRLADTFIGLNIFGLACVVVAVLVRFAS